MTDRMAPIDQFPAASLRREDTSTTLGGLRAVVRRGRARALPVFAWEVSLAIHLIAKGLTPARANANSVTEPGPRRPDDELGVPAQRRATAS
jgi:hypothetical protein